VGEAGGVVTYAETPPDWNDVPPWQPSDEEPYRLNGHGEDVKIPVLADRILTRSALRNLPDPEPLIDNVLDMGTTALLYGSWGTAKTFIALDWAASVATGRRWQGRETEQRKVLYVAGEGAFGFKGRIDAWEMGWHTKISDDRFSILPEPVNLTQRREVDQLMALVTWGGYDVIVLDTLARCMVGGDENSAKDTGVVVDAMTRLLHQTPDGRGVVLGVHHAGKDGKTLRGSSAFESGADTVYFSSRDGTGIILDREKRKDGPEADRHTLRLTPINGSDSCVIEALSGETNGETFSRGNKIMSHFVSHFSETGCTPSQLLLVSGMPKSTFHRGLNDLLKSGELVNIGSPKRQFLVRPGHE
jgi:hypothetical protein